MSFDHAASENFSANYQFAFFASSDPLLALSKANPCKITELNTPLNVADQLRMNLFAREGRLASATSVSYP